MCRIRVPNESGLRVVALANSVKQIQGTKPNKSLSLTTPHLIITFSPRPSIEGRGQKSPSSASTRKDEMTGMVERGGSLSWGMYRMEGREGGRMNEWNKAE